MDVLRSRRADEAYDEAMRHCANSILPMHFGEKLINKIFGRNLQSHAAGLLAVMHCEAELGLGERPTLTRIQAQMGRSRTLAGFFALLRMAGFVEAVSHGADRRAKVLVARQPLLDGLKTWLSHHMTCAEIAGLVPPGTAGRLKEDERFALHFIARAGLVLDRVRDYLRGESAWAWFDNYDCGDRIALALVRAHYDTEETDDGRWFALDARFLAERLGISHSHLRNVVNAAEARGLVIHDRRAHLTTLTPVMLADVRDFHLSFWGWIAETVERAETGFGSNSIR